MNAELLIDEICSLSKTIVNLVDATMVEVILYARGETSLYPTVDDFQHQLALQATAINEHVARLDSLDSQYKSILQNANPPQNVPGQILAIAEVLSSRLHRFPADDQDLRKIWFHSLPDIDRHELMERLRSYRRFMLRAFGVTTTDCNDKNFESEPIRPYWW